METADFFRARIDAMINLSDPLAVLARRLPWDQIEAAMLAKFEREDRAGRVLEGQDMFGATQVLEGAGVSNAGRPKLPIRLMASLLYLKESAGPNSVKEGARRPSQGHDPRWRFLRIISMSR